MRTVTRRDTRENGEAGFTLMEMVVAISVLAVVVLAVSAVFMSGLRALAAAKARARANEIATQGIEDLQRFSFNNLGLCAGGAATPPAGLETNVDLDCSGAGITLGSPCGAVGTVPARTYNCTDNNVTYTVTRYVAWVDALQTTKRLAVFVEWTDLAGNHQVSQQSSLRAPDQSAITGLAPPTFATVPSFGPSQVSVDATGRLAAPLSLTASTSDLHVPATGVLQTVIQAHQPNDHIDIAVGNAGAFPAYNGFSVSIGSEGFRVVGGAGTANWTVLAEESAFHAMNTPVKFAGDQVYAQIQTIADNGSPQTSTVFLNPLGSNPVTQWGAQITSNDPTPTAPFTFGVGKQYISFGIMRAADGKQTAAFAPSLLQICASTGCTTPPTEPTVAFVSADAAQIGSSGELLSDVVVEVSTTNVSSSDSVNVSFLTLSGSVTIGLQQKPGTTCPDSATATLGEPCHWQGRIEMVNGYRFKAGSQSFYFAAQQVVDASHPNSIDQGGTAAVFPAPTVTFAS